MSRKIIKRMGNFLLLKVVEIVAAVFVFGIVGVATLGLVFLTHYATFGIILCIIGGMFLLIVVSIWFYNNWKMAGTEKPLKTLWDKL